MLGTANASGGFTGYNRSGLFKLLNMNVLKLFLLMGKKRMSDVQRVQDVQIEKIRVEIIS